MGKGLLLWDIDGTLIEATSSQQIPLHRRALGHTISSENQEMMELSGLTDWQVLQKYSKLSEQDESNSPSRIESAFQKIDVLYRNDLKSHITITPKPGVVASLLNELAANWNLGILTGNTKFRASAKLSAAKLLEFFDQKYFFTCGLYESRDDIMARAEVAWRSFPMKPVAVIGDTPRDIETAKRFNLYSVAISSGKFSKSDLSKFKPDLLISNLSDEKKVFTKYLNSIT